MVRVTLARTLEMFAWGGWNHVQSFAIENLFSEYVLKDDLEKDDAAEGDESQAKGKASA